MGRSTVFVDGMSELRRPDESTEPNESARANELTPARALTRRSLLQAAAAAIPLSALPALAMENGAGERPLAEFSHDQVRVCGAIETAQRENVLAVMMGLDEDSLLYPYRHMAGQATPGVSLGGWYEYLPNYDYHHDAAGLAPGHSLGQWISALARLYAGSMSAPEPTRAALKARVERLTLLLGQSITPEFFAKTRFPGYTLDKLICGLLDAARYTGNAEAFATIDRAIAAAGPSLPGFAIEREVQWKAGYNLSWMWDENYTLPENLYRASELAGKAGQGSARGYRQMADAYLLDRTFFSPLSRNEDALADLHAYSHVNALCSAAQCYLTTGSAMHLEAARRGFAMVEAQSYATGGWGPDETLRKAGRDDVYRSLANTHNSFETPCGAYAHMKLTRYLLRATRDGGYGDSMERVFLNTILGVLPLEATGRSYYHSDYSFNARRVYSSTLWPCCSGTLPQVVADYGINTYLQAQGEIWINLYQPSELRATVSGMPVRISQATEYPFQPEIQIAVEPARAAAFTLRLRIPAWVDGATVRVNGMPQPITVQQGFAAIERMWGPRDVVTLNLPLTLRLEALRANGGPEHPELVALLYGPVVLFALHEEASMAVAVPSKVPYSPAPVPLPSPLTVPRAALLAAQRTGDREWTVSTPTRTLRMVPFTDVADRQYTTYVSAV